ncbi:MAG: PilZ domain-containing protein [Candidatus Acidiferrales bacterium]
MTPRAKKSAKAPKNWSAARAAERYSSLRDLYVTYEGHSDTIATRLPDISSRGMFINTSRHFPEGAVLNVRFRLAHTGVEVQSRCEVRYCLDGVGVGVEFVNIPPRVAMAIEEELHPTPNKSNQSSLRTPRRKKRASSQKKKKRGKR